MSISTGLYPTLDLWNVNKLHYIALQDGTEIVCFLEKNDRFSPSLYVMTLLQLFRTAVLRLYYSITEKQQLVSEKLVPYMHQTVNRNLFIIKYFQI
jgi:hypothetical protein